MKRSPMPPRRKPMARKGKLYGGTKRAEYLEQIRRARVLVERRSGCRCERNGCSKPYAHLHHMHRRSQGGTNHPSNLMAVCVSCHHWIHANVAESFWLGYLRKESRPWDESL